MLLGRQVEVHAIGALLAGARLSQGGALLITGEAGIGKSALLDYAAAQAHGLLVLRATGTESERDLPFAGLAQLLRPVVEHLAALPAPQAQALGVALALREGGRIERFAVGAATLGVLTHASEERPVVVIVDDAHLVDRSSQEAIAFAARRLLADPVCMLVGGLAGELSVLTEAGLPELLLAGLPATEAAQLAQTVSDVPLSTAVRERITDISGGNPLAIRELARDPGPLAELPPGAAAPLPATLSDLFARHASTLEPTTRRLLLLSAVADGDLPVMARACSQLGLDLAPLTQAERAGLIVVSVDRVEFTHPLAKAAVYAEATPEQRRVMHRAIANALPEGDLDRRAWHRCWAALGPDESVAASMDEVGARAAVRGAFAVAATAHERAARLSIGDADRARRFLAAGEAAWFAGEDERARGLLAETLTLDRSPRTRASAMAVQGLIAARGGSLAEARDILLTAADEAAQVTPEQALVMYADLVDVCLYLLDTAGALTAAERADRLVVTMAGSGQEPDDAATSGAPRIRTRADALASIATGMANVLAGKPSADRIRVGVEFLSQSPASSVDLQSAWDVLGPLFLRDSETGRDLVRHALAERRAAVAVGTLPHLLWHLARDDATTDQWSRAEAGYGEAISLAREFGQATELGASLAGLAWLTARQGAAAACRHAAAEAMEIGAAHQLELATVWARFALAELDLSTGSAAAAAEAFAGLADRLDVLGVLDADLSPVPELVEALLRTGQGEAAREAAPAYIDRAVRKGQPWARARAARVRGMLTHDEACDAAFDEALALHAKTLDRYEEARTRLVYGERLRRSRRRVDAREQLHQALHMFERLGAHVWADATLAELRATGLTAQRRGTGPVIDLTARELQIALLLAEGKTTRETAAALFVSPKTVEYHLRHVYTKLGIASRAELKARMHQVSPVTADETVRGHPNTVG